MLASTLKRTLIPITTIAVLALTGCSEETAPQSGAPELPPAESMLLDVSFFRGANAPGVQDAAGLKLNFMNAAVRAAFIDVAVVTALAPPHLAFAAAIHTIPSPQPDGSWLWIYTYNDGFADTQVRLLGTPDTDRVHWELTVVFPGASPELWFTGTSFTESDEGFWLFRDFTEPGDPEVLRVDWKVDAEDDAILELENVHVGTEEEGDLLTYRADGSLNTISFSDASEAMVWDIVWNAADGTGSLMVPDYNDGNRACWDANQEDVDCAAAAPAGTIPGPTVR